MCPKVVEVARRIDPALQARLDAAGIITIIGLSGKSISVPFRKGMLIKDIKEFVERPPPQGFGINKMQQRLMCNGTELKVSWHNCTLVSLSPSAAAAAAG